MMQKDNYPTYFKSVHHRIVICYKWALLCQVDIVVMCAHWCDVRFDDAAGIILIQAAGSCQFV